MELNQAQFCYNFLDHLTQDEGYTFIISPGSRSTPLVLAATEHPHIDCKVILDEREAGFFSLGLQKSGERSALICTSGSALTHYAPALSEASRSQTPFLIISADRPAELKHMDSNQTFEQQDFYSSTFAQKFQIDPLQFMDDPQALARVSSQIAFEARSSPTWVNMNFRKPLVGRVEPQVSEHEFYRMIPSEEKSKFLDSFIEALNTSKKPALILGKNAPLTKVDLPGLPVWRDITTLNHSNSCEHVFSSLSQWEDYQPDLVLYLGGDIIEQKIIKDLGIKISRGLVKLFGVIDSPYDTPYSYPSTNLILHKQKCDFSNIIVPTFNLPPKKMTTVPDGLNEINFLRDFLGHTKSTDLFYIGNSISIRAFDIIQRELNLDGQFITHRGLSGIDGLVASASGAASKHQGQTYLILGDLSLHHDSKAISLALENNCKIICFNNSGGGIFSSLPIYQQKLQYQKYFQVPTQLPRHQQATYLEIKSLAEIKKVQDSAWDILEVHTPHDFWRNFKQGEKL